MSHQVASLKETRAASVRNGRNLEYLTIGWNSLEGVASIVAGVLAGSIALVGFGFDSLIEVSSGAALLWRLHLDAPEKRERAEQIALKIVGASFVLLAAYIGFDAVKSLMTRETAERSYIGIAIAALSLVVMPMLARAKRRVAAEINSRAMKADSRQNDLCAYLSGDSVSRSRAQCFVRLVVGRCGRRARDGSDYCQRRH